MHQEKEREMVGIGDFEFGVHPKVYDAARFVGRHATKFAVGIALIATVAAGVATDAFPGEQPSQEAEVSQGESTFEVWLHKVSTFDLGQSGPEPGSSELDRP